MADEKKQRWLEGTYAKARQEGAGASRPLRDHQRHPGEAGLRRRAT